MSTASPAAPSFLSLPETAKLLRINESKLIHWIRTGELTAIDLSQNRNQRPRWKVSREELDRFLRSRQSTPAPEPPKRQRKKTTASKRKFF